MPEKLIFREAELQDIPQLVQLMNCQYARQKTESYFIWQYFQSHYPTMLMCALYQNQIIGMFGLQQRRLTNGAQVGQAIDLLTDKSWRGKGIFKCLFQQTLQHSPDYDVLCAFTNSNGRMACEKGLGWKTVAKIDQICLDKIQIIENHFHYFQFSWKTKSQFQKSSINTISNVGIEHFTYTKETCKWRFDQHPDYQYNYLFENGLSDFAVVKIFKDPANQTIAGDIVYYQCDINDYEVFQSLISKSILTLEKQGVDRITTWILPHIPLRQVTDLLGFTEVSQERYFCLKVINPQYNYLYDCSRWHLVQADSEIY